MTVLNSAAHCVGVPNLGIRTKELTEPITHLSMSKEENIHNLNIKNKYLSTCWLLS